MHARLSCGFAVHSRCGRERRRHAHQAGGGRNCERVEALQGRQGVTAQLASILELVSSDRLLLVILQWVSPQGGENPHPPPKKLDFLENFDDHTTERSVVGNGSSTSSHILEKCGTFLRHTRLRFLSRKWCSLIFTVESLEMIVYICPSLSCGYW